MQKEKHNSSDLPKVVLKNDANSISLPISRMKKPEVTERPLF